MRQFATITLFVLTASALARAQDESFRFFFDKAGTSDEQGPRPAGNLSFENPTIVNSGRLYLYLEYGMQDAATHHQDFSGLNLSILIKGPGVITGGTMFNHKSTLGLDRWGTITRKSIVTSTDEFGTMTIPGPIWRWGNVFKIGTAGFGAKNIASLGTGDPGVEDTHFARNDGSPFGTTLLAYVDFESTGTGTAGIFLSNGSSGSSGETISRSDFVYFGFGDPAFHNQPGGMPDDPGGPSLLPDAYIIPEPASVIAILVGAAAVTAGGRTRVAGRAVGDRRAE